MDQTYGTPEDPARRTVVAAVGATGLSAVLAACGGSKGKASGASNASDGGTTDGNGAQSSAPEGSAPASGGQAGMALAKTSEIPEGGGKIFADHKVVVTQPTAGQFKAFSSVCTHQHCAVSEVANGTINCPCHGSKFHISDGSVAQGPATAPLPAQKIEVQGDSISTV